MKFYLSDTNKIVRMFAYFIEIFVLTVLQNVPGLTMPIFTCTPLLSVAAALSIALIETEMPSMEIALIAGLLIDVTTATPFGSFAMFFVVICAFTSAFVQGKRRKDSFWLILTSVIATVLTFLALWFILSVAKESSDSILQLKQKFIPTGIYTLFVMPFTYTLNNIIHKLLKNRDDAN